MVKVSFREVIIARLEELGQNRLWLVHQCDGDPQKAQIYAYLELRERKLGNRYGLVDMKSANIEKIFGILGLDVTVVREMQRRPKKL